MEMENSSQIPFPAASGESNILTAGNETKADQLAQPTKKKRSLPGMPDPDAEVIALSPKTLLATNRFVCEICNKGFQRDQNLQLHRRGHNLPWKLRQRTSKEVRKRVYVCPEPTCVHHDPSRALGDLTGIKKHFCRKHGEKKYKCERCSKKYAVHSDWKAHMKTCGTREYRCDCGTLFSRRDSFITHRAFCDALAQEGARTQPLAATSSGGYLKVQVLAPPPATSSPPPPPLTPSTGVLSPVLSIQSSGEVLLLLPKRGFHVCSFIIFHHHCHRCPCSHHPAHSRRRPGSSSTSTGLVSGSTGIFSSIFNASTSAELPQPPTQPASYPGLICAMAGPDHQAIDPISLSLSSSLYGSSSLFSAASEVNPQLHYGSSPQPALSATALLQKAAQIGATSSSSSFLRGLGLAMPSSSKAQDNASTMASATSSSSTPLHWTSGVKLEINSLASGLGLGLSSSGSSGFNGSLMSPSTSLYGNKPTTLDFLGLGVGASETSSSGLSAFLSSIGGGLDVASASLAGVRRAGDTWDDPVDRKPSV
ncbi:Zinc finger protein ENHYDROUS [Sesamum angolense]|uniref:Zinc finger protein ENHYDROUS n=1 Tax=Sesamum angolense TaxID=2727404 RepID=A0AAE2BJF2_9LAMI|nr:Zinc finger protein ENHYDROUS [Sesamum angolense]